jgi:Protein of unknown function (DUF1194)
VSARTQRLALRSTIGAIMMAATLLAFLPAGEATDPPGAVRVDTALIMAVDVSGSVDERRYRLQMDGIARALVDPVVVNVIVSGQNAAILFSIVTWADHPRMALPWVRISNQGEAEIVAALVRGLPREGGNFTCMARMLRHLADKVVPQIPAMATRVVVDVSGDGRDNCNPAESVAAIRDELSGAKRTINGLPILEGREVDTLEAWYRQNVKSGPGSFVLPASGYEDFGRAIRQKFVTEISQSVAHGAIHVAGFLEIDSTVTADKPGQTR